ncbi:hypothetical protein L0F51_00380 [Afifella sp. H1R]|uniref:hypothetical protein n=1 Tax=Afifella sp. H1R TaxID=2908841 RepID=UPI001F290958|nr:hypothetical protein [Afifella sp. H1R]MCF1502219.1 hypothetical protein [Afifella sp. H1R]
MTENKRSPLRLAWRHTWPKRGPDFTAKDAADGVGRIYRTYHDGDRSWYWCASRTTPLGSGFSASKIEAARMAEEALLPKRELKTTSRERLASALLWVVGLAVLATFCWINIVAPALVIWRALME